VCVIDFLQSIMTIDLLNWLFVVIELFNNMFKLLSCLTPMRLHKEPIRKFDAGYANGDKHWYFHYER